MFPILNINRLLITWCSSVVSSKNSRKRISMIGVLPRAFLEHGNNRNMCLNYYSSRFLACCLCLQCFCCTELRILGKYFKLTSYLCLSPVTPQVELKYCWLPQLTPEIGMFLLFQKSLHLLRFHRYKMLTLQKVAVHNTCTGRATKS